jgi:two-component system sensor histidine kinase/response regulator
MVPVQLAILPGLDTRIGLSSLNGNVPVYLRLLKKFALSHQADILQLRGHLAAGNRDAARRLAHTLKGVGATLGMMALREQAMRLESAIMQDDSGPQFESLVAAVDGELTGLAAAILSGLPDEAQGAVALDFPALRQLFGELDPLLAAGDICAEPLFRKNIALLRAALGPQAAVLEAQMDGFMYVEALATLRQAKSEHPEFFA